MLTDLNPFAFIRPFYRKTEVIQGYLKSVRAQKMGIIWAKHKRMQIFELKMGPTLYIMTKRERYVIINFGCKFFQDWPREVQFAVFGYVLIVLFCLLLPLLRIIIDR